MTDILTRTPAQVSVTVHYDGELGRPVGIGNDFYRKARLMRRDPTIKLARWFATAPIVGSSWSVECEYGVPSGAKELIEGMSEYLRHDLVQTALYGLYDHGWQGYEKSFIARPDNLYWCQYLKPLYADWTYILVLEKTGEFAGFRQDPQTLTKYHGIELYLSTEESMLLYIDAEGTNWYGEAVMKAAEKAYDDWVICNQSAEKYDKKIAGSHWVVYYPRGTSMYNGVDTDNAVIANEIAQNMRAVSSVAIPRSVQEVVDTMSAQAASNESLQWKIDLLSDKSSAQSAIIDRLKYLDGLKFRAFGLPERSGLEGTYGTKAEAESHADLAILCLEMRHQGLCNQINRDLINQTMMLNYGPGYEDKVYLKPAPLTDEAKAFLREIYKTLVMAPEEIAQLDMKALRDRLKVPTLEYSDPAYSEPPAYYDELGNPIYAEIAPAEGLEGVQFDPYAADAPYGSNGHSEPFAASRTIALAYNPNQPRNEKGQFDSGGPSVAKAKALGFTPTSRDSWINQQQAKEFLVKKRLEKMAEKRDEKIVKRAEKLGFKPTSSDKFINAQQAQQFIEAKAASRTSGESKPKKASQPKKSSGPQGPALIDEAGGLLKGAISEVATVAQAAPSFYDPNQIR
jgi:hypothetical protein